MAKEFITRITDDLDGTDGAEAVPFSIDGKEYTIDLGPKNATALREVFAPYIQAAARVHTASTRVSRGGTRRRPTAYFNGLPPELDNPAGRKKIREWGVANGYEVGSQGKISGRVTRAYLALNQEGLFRVPT